MSDIEYYLVQYSAKVKTPLKGSSNFGHYGTRVRCQKLSPQRGLNFDTPRYLNVLILQIC
jgi:hypothetical protein